MVGGISRTVERDGWRFDIGGHRFFTKVQPVEELWHEILPPEDFLLRPRMSRIFYDGKYYDYPLRGRATPSRTSGCGRRCSVDSPTCGPASGRPRTRATTRVGWWPGFGWRLYRTFFKTYTEKVWGVPVTEMPADWAAQRVKNLDLGKAVLNALAPNATRPTSPA